VSRRPRDGSVLMVEAHGGSGGPPTTLLDLVPELSRRRRVTVAIPPGGIAEELAVRAPGARVELLPRWRPDNRGRARLQSAPLLRREIAAHSLVHANGKSALNLVAPVLATRWRKPPVFVHFHDSDLTRRNIRVLRLWSRLGIVTGYAPVSELAAQLLTSSRLGPVAGKLANPIPAGKVQAVLGGPPYSFAYVGSRDPRKGLDLLVEVAYLLRELPCIWHVYGVVTHTKLDPFTQRCINRVTALGLDDRVVWEGRQRGLARRLADHHALLLPSRRESFCRVAIEAMAAGLPVVAGDIPGLDEAVGEGNCVLFDLDDLETAANELASVVTDESRFLQLQTAGLARARQFTPARVCDQLESLYERL
jgi:glycosyltransferase involved in cell wall biosynthesis